VSDKVITPQSEIPALYPKTGGNLHCFTALTPCAVLDILSPPYKESVGRSCSYYMDYPFSTFGMQTFSLLPLEEHYVTLFSFTVFSLWIDNNSIGERNEEGG